MPAQGYGNGELLNPYLVSSSEIQISLGDAVVLTTIGTVRPTSGTWSTGILGIAGSVVLAGDGSTGANPTASSTQICLVYDDPDQVFVTHDSTSGVVLTSGIGRTYSIISSGVTGSTGINTKLNRSVMVLSGAGAGSTSALLPFKYLGMHPAEMGVLTSGTTTVTSSGTRLHLVQVNLAARSGGFVSVTT